MEQFDAEECLKTIELQRCTALVLVPVMLQRILELPAAVINRYDTSSLKVVDSSGSPIPGAAVVKFMDTFGDILYNFYGSTEVSWATIADPTDLRIAPTTAGRPPLGTRITIASARTAIPCRSAPSVASSSATTCCSTATPMRRHLPSKTS